MAAGPLIAIVGQTATGKTALAIDIAQKYGGEIICADSRTIYRGMDISTAKPTPAEQQAVPHHLLDIVTPDEAFSAADFQRYVKAAVTAIEQRRRVPIIAGGSGLFVDAVLYDFSFNAKADSEQRQALAAKSVAELQEIIKRSGLALPYNAQNPRHLMRAIETGGQTAIKKPLRSDTLLLGLSVEPSVLKTRIEARVESMLAAGLIDEVRFNAQQYGWGAPGLQEPAYKALKPYIEDTASLDVARADLIRQHWQFAKRQRTWFIRNRDIMWVNNSKQAMQAADKFMSNYLLQ